MNIKVCLAGKNNIAINVLESLLQKIEIEKIYVIPNESDDKVDKWQRSFYKYSLEKKIKIIDLDIAYNIENLIFLSLEYDKIVKVEKFRESAKLYNVHFSKLPKYKGMYTSVHPILNNEKESGVTLHKMDNGIDTGEIIDQSCFEIEENDTARSLYFKYIDKGTKLVLKNLDNLLSGNIECYSQNYSESTYFSKSSINYRELKIDLNQTAKSISNQIRAYNFREYQLPKVKNCKIISFKITEIKSREKPGTIIYENELLLMLATIDYNIVLYKDRSEELFLACETGNIEKINQICVIKEHIDVQNKRGWTPLIVATYNGHKEVVKFLVGLGANINLTNFNGTNLLMYAKDFYKNSNNREIYDFFIRLGLKKEQTDYFGKSLIDYLNEEGINLD